MPAHEAPVTEIGLAFLTCGVTGPGCRCGVSQPRGHQNIARDSISPLSAGVQSRLCVLIVSRRANLERTRFTQGSWDRCRLVRCSKASRS